MTPHELLDSLTEQRWADDLPAAEIHTLLDAMLRLRNVVEHHAATLAARLDQLDVKRTYGRSVRELLITMGTAPSVASRLLRLGRALSQLPRLAGHTADGTISGEHADALVRGMTHIESRNGAPLDESASAGTVTDLLAQAISGATPAEITARARTIGNRMADLAEVGVPAAEDRSVNEFTVITDSHGDGRTSVRGDLDAVIGEKLHTMIDGLSAPRPEPDGSPDSRTIGRRRAEALERILDAAAAAADHGLAPGVPKHEVLLTIPADDPDRSTLAWTGPVSMATTSLVTCDATITEVAVDADTAPVAIGQGTRLFGPKLRKALAVRDGGCCIKCGAPAAWAHAHHITHFANGGKTVLDNGCLLCPSCHTDVHHNGWDVRIGSDRHPWLIPPATVDPRRRPLPAYNRRTMRLDDVAA